jgi:hypothetical protein
MTIKFLRSFTAMICVAALSSFVATGGAKPTASPPDAATEIFGHSCAVYVYFGSYAMGIDHDTFLKTQAILKADKGVTKVERKNQGREGEQALCVHTKGKTSAKRVYQKITKLFSSKLEHRGPVGVTMR